MELERSNFGPIQIDIGHRTRPPGVSAQSFSVKPVRIKIPIEVVVPLSSLEEEKDGHYDSEDGDGRSDDTAGDGPSA